MNSFLAALRRQFSAVLDASRSPAAPARSMTRGARSFHCVCGQAVFFDNSRCLACGRELGLVVSLRRVVSLQVRGEGLEGLGEAAGQRFVRCDNSRLAAACNWLIPAAERDGRGRRPLHCAACRLNRTIPDLALPANAQAWARIEAAKRRLVSQLLGLGLPVASRLPDAGAEDLERGLAFDFLREWPGGPPVLTGHAGGIITLDVEEADDVERERTRTLLHEHYRTVLGHLRHEVGHYYWDRLVADGPWLEAFRTLFGDERVSYRDALQRHYDQGPTPDWPQRHVSAYASSHPWEDWAETWAHYLHITDGLDTALSFGLDAGDVRLDLTPFPASALDTADPAFLQLINAWVELSGVLNEVARSLGQPDLYPFVLGVPAVRKLHLVHRVVQAQALQAGRAD
ncbi:hypothetical protein C7444_12319 [Sphaerotilus hippei]|uniref:Zinc-ribbon domain-containing protein n=1 Tax=Sphaerotilus hippei TaxID=744406 RepID=A0A318GVF9_9BURK|nr:putative zinc-binding metallopeptidase [Sphaerotilus hippei]PXW92768.1 hypothetical protein C7444_12319 [Sphaerotilus hippei]